MTPSQETVIIRLAYLGSLRHHFGRKDEEFVLCPPVSVRDVVDRLIEIHGPKVRDLFFNQYGWLDPRLFFVIDGESGVTRTGLDAPLTGTEEVQLMLGMPMAGG